MNRKKIYGFTAIFFAVMIGVVVTKYYQHERNFDPVLERQGEASRMAEWAVTRNYAEVLSSKLSKNPDDVKSILALTTLFIREARVTGNNAYYDRAALKAVNYILNKDSTNFEALSFKSFIYLSQHHFADGLALAEKARRINPFNAFIYGLLVDGNVEMGNYDSAVTSADAMMSIRPDIRSYARVSYLREIYGDFPGAIEAMKMAVEAGAPGDETTAWTEIQLGRLFENTGDMQNAEKVYASTLTDRPGYAYALAGLARIETSKGNIDSATIYYERAIKAVPDAAFKEALSDLYRSGKDFQKANAIMQEVINQLNKDEQAAGSDENIGHYSDRELAYAYISIGDYKKALEHALLEYNRRPENIDVNETLAWVYYKQGAFSKALPYIETALRTHAENPVLLIRAGLIYAKSGNRIAAKSMINEGLKFHANIPMSLKTETMTILQSL